MVPELLLQRTTTLAPEPASAGVARRFVRSALLDSGRPEWVDRAELAVSELVTNAILHAHTELLVDVTVTATDATVNVRDNSPQLPTQRHWGASATTGRGLALVASLSVTYGVDLETDGKSVWFRLDESASLEAELAMDADVWDLDGLLAELEMADLDMAGDPTAGRLRGVQLQAVPVLLWFAAQQHQEAVLRELFLMQEQAEDDIGHLDLIKAGRAQRLLSAAVDRAVDEGIAAGLPLFALPKGHPSPLGAVPRSIDADVFVPDDSHADFTALQDALDAGLRLGAADRMLIRPALPELVALRDWSCEQVLAQVNGVAGTPWGGADHPRFVDPASATDTAPAPRWDGAAVLASDRVVLAADDNNRLVAVSRPAAEMLGWTVEELTGRRVVSIVPERLREAHVAGFARHLTTGEVHVLGIDITLPVLRRDGSEVLCSFFIEQAPAGAGRAVYVAWLTPLD
ncbi:MAG: hypothetical protein QOH99_1538 [Frankiaceae bacterium]|nr:hypothetical protein [Frankiaceae bacterium]